MAIGRTRLALIACVALAACSGTSTARSPQSNTSDRWPPRGELAGDQNLLAASVAAWDAGFQRTGLTTPARFPPGTGPHRGPVRLLYAGDLATGRLVVLEGGDINGHQRLIVVAAPFGTAKNQEPALVLTNDVARPSLTNTRVLMFPRELLDSGPPDGTGPRFYRHESVLILGDAAVSRIRYSLKLGDAGSVRKSGALTAKAGAAVLDLSAARHADALDFVGDATAAAVTVSVDDDHRTYTVELLRPSSPLYWGSCLICQG